MQAALAADGNVGLKLGYHIWHSHTLTDIAATPGTFDEVSPTQWNTALPALARNNFAFEPYGEPGTTSTLGSETAAFNTLVASVNSGPTVNPHFFIYEPWTATSDYTNFQTWWTTPVTQASGTTMILQLGAFNYIYAQLQATLGSNVWVVPVGDVMYQLDIASRASLIPNATKLQDWYRDGIHMGRAGQFAAACTFFSTYFRKPCTPSAATIALANTLSNGTSPVILDATLAAQIATIVWNVVSTDPRAIH
jgi:hypothetical protein